MHKFDKFHARTLARSRQAAIKPLLESMDCTQMDRPFLHHMMDTRLFLSNDSALLAEHAKMHLWAWNITGAIRL